MNLRSGNAADKIRETQVSQVKNENEIKVGSKH